MFHLLIAISILGIVGTDFAQNAVSTGTLSIVDIVVTLAIMGAVTRSLKYIQKIFAKYKIAFPLFVVGLSIFWTQVHSGLALITTVGAIFNALVVWANGGKMPVRVKSEDWNEKIEDSKQHITKEDPKLALLCDRYALSAIPFTEKFESESLLAIFLY